MESKIKSLYVHIPFCAHICSYCDFCKLQYNEKYISNYLAALKDELNSYKIGKCKTIYIGGGTPTSLCEKELDELLSMLDDYVQEDCEYSIEVNPETINEEKIKIIKKHGINRMSIGVQSFNDGILRKLNRYHHKDDIDKLISYLEKYQINNFSFDFIYGINGQTIDDIKKDLDTAFNYPLKHISLYSLMIEPNTVFYIKHEQALDDDNLREMYDYIKNYLKSKGFVHYEVSNFALNSSYYSKHNLTYWSGDEYYGVGLGASGYVNGIRYQNTRSLNDYLNHKFTLNHEAVSLKDQEFEYIMLNLRTNSGIDILEYNNKFKRDFLKFYQSEIESLTKNNLIEIKNDHVVVTEDGIYILDSIITKFVIKFD
jgi:oxygen-independent coproporphyrinogen-3 oxidase